MNVSLKNNKKAVAGVGVVAAAAAVLAIGAGTFASFSATAPGPNATVAAGTLQFGGAANNNFEVGPLAPGQSSTATVLTFTNGGSTNGKLTLGVAGVTDIENGCNGDEPLHEDNDCNNGANRGDLSPRLDARVTDGNGVVLFNGPATALGTSPITLASNQAATVSVVFTFRENGPGDNIAQGDRATFATTARLDQA